VVCFLFLAAKVEGGVGWVLTRAFSGPFSGVLFGGDTVSASQLAFSLAYLVAVAAHPWWPRWYTAVLSSLGTVFWLLVGLGSQM
jgi:hypothetical protein